MKFLISEEKITIDELKKMAENRFGDLVKAVIDIEKEIIALDAELHSDQEAELLKKGSKPKNLWGINLYPDLKIDDMVKFDSMINLRPSQDNRSRGVENPKIRKKILKIIKKMIKN